MIKFVVLAVLFGLLQTCSAEEVISSPELTRRFLVPRFNVTGTGPEDYECISARAADYYGVGVRLGIYFSWWTAWAASAGMPDEISTALDLNTVFLFANAVALVRCTITFVLTQLDGLILMHLGMGTIIGVLSNWGYRTCFYKKEGITAMKNFSGVGTHLRLLCSLAICIYGAWYWYTGVMPDHREMLTDDNQCRTTYTFLFTKFDAAGPIRIFYLFFTILWSIHFGISIFTSPVAAWVRFRELRKSSLSIDGELPKELRLATGLNYKQLCYLFNGLRVFTAFWLFWSMLTVEMSLNYNHVKKVLGPGGRIYFPSQLIPMILGAFTFVRLLWKKWVQKRRRNHTTDVIEKTSEPDAQPSTSVTVMKMITPSAPVPKKEDLETFSNSDIDDRMAEAPLVWRVIVTYLPWFSLLSRFKVRGRTMEATSSDYASKDVENVGFWDQDTPRMSPDSREDGKHLNTMIAGSGKPTASKRSDRFSINRFQNTIS